MSNENERASSSAAITAQRSLKMMTMTGLPGNEYKPDYAVNMSEGQVLLLWSRWGVEGVYTHPDKMAQQVLALREMRAYADEPFTYEARYLDQVN